MTLGRAYDEIMEHVAVTEQMRQRILTRVADTDFAPSASVPRVPAARRYWAAAACAALLLAGAAVARARRRMGVGRRAEAEGVCASCFNMRDRMASVT